jgi:hypothetical protein
MNKKKSTLLIALTVCASVCTPSALQAQSNNFNNLKMTIYAYKAAHNNCHDYAKSVGPFKVEYINQCMEYFLEYSCINNASCSLYKKNFYKKKSIDSNSADTETKGNAGSTTDDPA